MRPATHTHTHTIESLKMVNVRNEANDWYWLRKGYHINCVDRTRLSVLCVSACVGDYVDNTQ